MKEAGQVRKDGFDKFYTISSVVERCISIIGDHFDWNIWDQVVEPSAGNGSFLLKIPTDKKIGLDVLPEHEDIIKQDFLKFEPSISGKILVIGNPPFGKISSLAIKFFNHSAGWCDVIAFIVPRTFRRISVQNKLDEKFHLIYDEDIGTKPCAFEPPMMAKCCFQIWEKREIKRIKTTLEMHHVDWEFLPFGEKDSKSQPTPPSGADFALRAYGGKCGEIKRSDLNILRPKSWHWIKSNIDIDELIDRFQKLDYSISTDTARQNSIGRGELVSLYQSR